MTEQRIILGDCLDVFTTGKAPRRKTGPKPKRADGFHVTRKGYLRGRVNGRMMLAHVAVWEASNGPVPPGMCLHHINHDKQDNRVENLELVNATVHKRIHGGCELRDGVWWKPCRSCGLMKPIGRENWYLSAEGWPLYGRCRSCHIAKVCANGRRKIVAPESMRHSSTLTKASS